MGGGCGGILLFIVCGWLLFIYLFYYSLKELRVLSLYLWLCWARLHLAEGHPNCPEFVCVTVCETVCKFGHASLCNCVCENVCEWLWLWKCVTNYVCAQHKSVLSVGVTMWTCVAMNVHDWLSVKEAFCVCVNRGGEERGNEGFLCYHKSELF